MAGEDGTAARALALERALEGEPHRFDFFQALRRIECAHPDAPRLGRSLRPADDPIRLGQEPSLVFAPSSLASYEPGREGRPPRLLVYFLGLLGPNGPLPLHLTEYARDRLRNSHDPTFARFLDLFHHRMISLFYRGWANAQPTVNFDRPGSDRFALYVGALFGLAMPSLRDRDRWPDLAKLHYAGHLSCQAHNADGLRAVLGDYFRLAVDVEQFVGQWLELPEPAFSRLGLSRDTCSLGRSVILGSRSWECQHKFRVVIGPLGFADYESLLPGGESLDRLVALVRNCSGDELAWDVALILKKEDVPPLRLGGERGLGWTTWLAGRPFEQDPADLHLDPLAGSYPSARVEVGGVMRDE